MRFGISLVAAGQETGYTQARMVAERVEMVRVAHAAGFEVVSAGQHYCPPDGLMPQPLPLLARLAPEGPGMTFQTGVLLGPFYHPVTLAEEMATVHAMTGNRFRAAIGLAYREQEFSMFGQHSADRLKRVIELVKTTRALLRRERVTVEDGFYPMRDVALAPGTVDGDPPGILIGTGTLQGARRAARIADGLYTTGYLPKSEVRQLVGTYLGALGGGARPTVGIRREVTLAESRKAAMARSLPGWIRTLRSYLSTGLEQPSLPRIIEELETDGDSADLPFVVGSPEECAEQALEYAAMGVQDIVLRFQVDGTDATAAFRAIEAFGRDVIPLVRKAAATPALAQ